MRKSKVLEIKRAFNAKTDGQMTKSQFRAVKKYYNALRRSGVKIKTK